MNRIDDSTPTPPWRQASITARDEGGLERPLAVDELRGLIVIRDQAMVRVLTPDAALDLANQVIQACIRLRRRKELGPFSSGEDI